jgi:lipoprotein LpqB-like beta-propeller protein/sporulation and spore germination protein
MRRWTGALLAALTLLLAGCANIPDQSTPQAVGTAAQPPGVTPPPDPKADPYTLVRNFVGEAGNPEAAKGYLSDSASWQSDGPPTIIDKTFGTLPIPAQERKAQGDDGQGNEVTVVLTVTKVGRLGTDHAFIPIVSPGPDEYRVVVRRKSADDFWRIQTPPDTVLITLDRFIEDYQRVSVYYFDPEFRVTVPDIRYINARPAGGAPDRVMRELLDGPSEMLRNAVKSALPPEAEMRTNAVSDSDGALVVNLTKLGERTPDERAYIAAQVVLSLKDVVQTKIRLLADGHALISGHTDWRPSEVPSYDLATRPSPDLTGMFTGPAGRVYNLRDGTQIQGPAGSGEIKVVSAAQSIDGRSLAVVQELPTGVRLLVGGIGPQLHPIDLTATTLTRPTWLLGATGGPSNEVWTVQNGVDVVRTVRTGNDTWAPSPVITTDLRPYGTITDLRLSRDGVRIAAVISGHAVVASVVRTKDSVSIRSPRTLRPSELTTVVGVDWLNQDTVVVATGQTSQPVVNVPVNGFELIPYNSSNLGPPITAIAAAPDRSIIVTDSRGMWEATEIRQIWHLHSTQVAGARPFYPG